MRQIKIKKRIDTVRLLERERSEKTPRVARRIQTIRLVKEGVHSTEEIGAIVGHSSTYVRNCVKRFNEEGFEGLVDKPKGRPKGKLTPEQMDQFEKWIEEGPSDKEFFSVWTGPTLVQKIQEEFNITVSDQSIYDWLKKLGYRHGKPRPIPGKADIEELSQFQKNFKRRRKKQKNQAQKLIFTTKTKLGSVQLQN